MIRINPTNPAGRSRSAERVGSSAKKSRAASARSASFTRSLSQASGADAVEALEATEAQGALSEAVGDVGLLALQEGGAVAGRSGEEGARRRAIAYGEGLIERLQALHVRLLSGVVSEGELLRLEGYFAEQKELAAVEDEKLRSILNEIELRVQVELAKRR